MGRPDFEHPVPTRNSGPVFSPTIQPGGETIWGRITAVHAAVGASGPGTGYVPHSWQQVRPTGTGRDFADDERGLTGSASIFPAYDPNGATITVGSIVRLKLRAWSDADAGPIWDIVGLPSTGSTGGTGGGTTTGGGAASASGARLTNSADQVIGGGIVVGFDGEDFDTDNYHDNTVNNSRITIPSTGYYLVGYELWIIPTGTAVVVPDVVATLLKNGGTVAHRSIHFATEGYASTTPFSAIASTLLYLTAGDYLQVAVYGNHIFSVDNGSLTNPSPIFWISRQGS